MTEQPIYQTTLAPKARRKLLLNTGAMSLLCVLSGFQWFSGGHWLQGVIFFISLPVAVLVFMVFLRSRHPLEIFEDRIALNGFPRTVVQLSTIKGIGTHPKRGEPSLTFNDEEKGFSGELAVAWSFIKEPPQDVLEQVSAAIARNAS
jgi:hypothetical protein